MSTALGDVVRLSWGVTDASGTASDATVTFSITQPDGTTLTIPSTSITHDGTGAYHFDFTPTQIGRHQVSKVASGAVVDASGDVFEVDGGADAPIVGLDAMKRHLNIPAAQTTNDDELYEMGRALSDAMEAHLGFPVRVRTVTDVHDGGKPKIYLRKAPCACAVCANYRTLTITSVVENGVNLAVTTDYLFDQASGALLRGPYGIGIAWLDWRALDVVITYQTGYAQTPPWARQAFLRALANSWQRTQQRPHPGIAQAPMTDEGAPQSLYALPYHVAEMLQPHKGGPW